MKMRLTLLGFAVALLTTFGLAFENPGRVAAASPLTQFAACKPSAFFGFPSWDACLPRGNDGEIKISKLEDLWLIAFPVVESMIRAAGYISVGFVIWGSIKFIKSQGDPSQIVSGRDTIRDALIGLVICVLSVAVVQFVAGRF